jgi:hypothetical protein
MNSRIALLTERPGLSCRPFRFVAYLFKPKLVARGEGWPRPTACNVNQGASDQGASDRHSSIDAFRQGIGHTCLLEGLPQPRLNWRRNPLKHLGVDVLVVFGQLLQKLVEPGAQTSSETG